MLIRHAVAGAALGLTCPAAQADDPIRFTDQNGARYTILHDRPFGGALKAIMVEIVNGDSVIMMEMALDCPGEQYSYLGMVFDLPVDAPREADVARVMGYSDSVLTDKIGGLHMTQLDVNLENDSVIRLFDEGCGRG